MYLESVLLDKLQGRSSFNQLFVLTGQTARQIQF